MGAARVGKTLGNFRILECLGSGGSGMIWKAEDLSLGRSVALKALRAELAADAEMSQRFRAEARTLAKLSHANVASLYSLIEDDDGIYLVLEYVEGNTLAALLATSGPLPLDTAFALFHQVLDGVGHAHDAGVVHRDLKPSNLMVDARGRVKVMDFGIARVAGAARTTHHGKLVGTPEYMSPEQVRGEDATMRSDIYSLGIVLFEMLTGRPPFRAVASFELMRAQIEDPPPDPRSLRPELDARVAAAILRALAKRPAERFASTRELQDALLDAGASRRAPAFPPLWRELPPAVAASEAPTLANFTGPEPPPPPPEPSAAPAATAAPVGSVSETRGAWERAVDAFDDDLGAVKAGREAEQADPQLRAKAQATVVLDVLDDTAQLETPRPTRMLADAPFAASARAIRARSPGTASARAGALWAALAVALLALAFGAVRLRERARVQTVGAPEPATAPASGSPAPPAAAPATPARAADANARAPEEAPPTQPPRAERRRVQERSASRGAAQPAEPARAAKSAEESGWVIRR